MAGGHHSRNPAPLLHLPPQETEASRRDHGHAIAGRTRWRDGIRYAVFQVLRILAHVLRVVIERRAPLHDGQVRRRGLVKVPLAVGRWYNSRESGCHLGNIS